jgi:hypothetical protein
LFCNHLNLIIGVSSTGNVDGPEDGGVQGVLDFEDVGLLLQARIRIDESSTLKLHLDALRKVFLESGVGFRRSALFRLFKGDPFLRILRLPFSDGLGSDAGEDSFGGDVVENVFGNGLT